MKFLIPKEENIHISLETSSIVQYKQNLGIFEELKLLFHPGKKYSDIYQAVPL